ncbi:YobA family protein [Pseudalkalibacillus berkeleyi]|uniref:YobA family protein n=1 Tax=Pseudalkalibacillus berkeleyi TaxID=1069813 RepID=A0ABS9H135_9BACL|nr:YobA family protein [Pseudalkalibacillus berkeleyi]MCF6138709.1 YobA family protein [Pseudalkalibacillus berkeleyi]
MRGWYYKAWLLLIILLAGCGGQTNEHISNDMDDEIWEQSISGYIADQEASRILVLGKITKEQLTELSVRELLESARPDAFWFTVSDVQKYKIGQKVQVWPKGSIAESYPAQGTAGKIEVIEEE